MIDIPNQYIRVLYRGIATLLFILAVFFAIKTLAEFRSYGMMGSSEANTITLSGHGEVQAVPDIANVYFTITKDAKTVKEAQDAVALVEKSALDSLKANNVADKDIQASNSSFYPKYENQRSLCPPILMMDGSTQPTSLYCGSGKQTIIGYQASESITVKVRNTDSAGKIMQDLGALGVTDLSGPNFSIDNEDNLKAEARKKAIDNARTKAEALAKDLGVRLGRISSFSESGNYFPMYGKTSFLEVGADSVSAPAPAELPKGENTISSDVTITYEIR